MYASNFWLNTYYAVGCSKSVAPEKGTMLLLRSTCGFNQTIFKKCIQYKLFKYICNHLKSFNQISDKTNLIWIINLSQAERKATVHKCTMYSILTMQYTDITFNNPQETQTMLHFKCVEIENVYFYFF